MQCGKKGGWKKWFSAFLDSGLGPMHSNLDPEVLLLVKAARDGFLLVRLSLPSTSSKQGRGL
jgi:hypothetical protein